VIRDDDDGAKVVEVVSVLPATQHGARPWVAWIDGSTAAGRTDLDAVARLARLCMWAVREILAPGEPTRAEAVAAERERCARLCDEVVVDCWARSGAVNGPTYAGAASGAKRCAAKIRAGGV
jgi:hypothetical protein